MSSLYTDEVRKIITEAPWPKGLQYDVFEGKQGDMLWLVFYRDNLHALTGADKEQIKTILLGRISQIHGLGIPITPTIEDTRIN